MHEEFRKRVAKEYRYAVTKMQQSPEPAKKLFYFSVFFGEAQRILNLEWDSSLLLIYTITQHVHVQITGTTQERALSSLPIDWVNVFEKLTQEADALAGYFEKEKNDENKVELFQILEHLAKIAYSVGGNGSYLHEKGVF